MGRKPCIVCGYPSDQARCEAHRKSNRSLLAPLDSRHTKLKKATVAAWVRINGWVCPGFRRPAHRVGEGGLEGEHIVPRSLRPDLAYEPSNMSVLCRSCNARKGKKLL